MLGNQSFFIGLIVPNINVTIEYARKIKYTTERMFKVSPKITQPELILVEASGANMLVNATSRAGRIISITYEAKVKTPVPSDKSGDSGHLKVHHAPQHKIPNETKGITAYQPPQ